MIDLPMDPLDVDVLVGQLLDPARGQHLVLYMKISRCNNRLRR